MNHNAPTTHETVKVASVFAAPVMLDKAATVAKACDLIKQAAKKTSMFIAFELNTGQMIEDVQLALQGEREVHFYGRPGGAIPTPVELGRVISRHYYHLDKKGGSK